MKIKDSTIILLLILTWIFLFCVMLGTENEINNITELLERIEIRQEEQALRIADIERMNESQELRFADIEQVNRVQDLRLDLHRQELDDHEQMFDDLLSSTERLEEYMKSLPDNSLGLDISEEDEYLIAQMLYLEAGADWCSYELQKAVVSVFLNHMLRYGRNVHQTLYYPGAFSVAARARYQTPSARCRMAVRDVLENGLTMPTNVMLFQTGNYHRIPGSHPYCRIQNVYFSTM